MEPFVKLPIILLLSDNKAIVSFFKKTAKECYLLIAHSGDECSTFLETNEVSLMLVDEDTNDLNPFQFSMQLRAIPAHMNMPLILLTSHLKRSYTEKALLAGYNDFLQKPLVKQEVEQRIQVGLAALQTKKKTSTFHPQPVISSKKLKPHFYSAYLNALTKTKQIGLPACLLLIEEDHYPQILKKGKTHAAKLLKKLRSSIEEYLRSKDLLFAQNNDGSFLLILPQTTQPAGKAFAEMLRKEIGELSFKLNHEEFVLTLSIGVVYYEDKGHPIISSNDLFEKLFESARKALEFAKKSETHTSFLSPKKEDRYETIV
jgi:PleD family two-component response regulator